MFFWGKGHKKHLEWGGAFLIKDLEGNCWIFWSIRFLHQQWSQFSLSRSFHQENIITNVFLQKPAVPQQTNFLCSSAFSQMNTIRKSTQIFFCVYSAEISIVSSRASKTEGPHGVIRDKMLSVSVSQSVATSSLINGAFLWLKSDYKNHNFPVWPPLPWVNLWIKAAFVDSQHERHKMCFVLKRGIFFHENVMWRFDSDWSRLTSG